MRRLLMATLAAATLRAAVIRGVVVDNQTGHPVARATIVAHPIAGTNGETRSALTDLNGAFELPGMAAGAWLIVATRRGFAPTRYDKGPVRVDDQASASLNIRLRRFGSISGTVLDENDVGLQEHDVVAYRNSRPLLVVARAKTDDRGVYRIEGLEPGTYLVRTAGGQYDEGVYLPTFSRETAALQESRPVVVEYDVEATNVDVRPFPGRLFSFAGRAVASGPVSVSLISDTGVRTVTADARGNFQFPPVPPGRYELYARSRDLAAWQTLDLYRNVSDHVITPAPYPELRLAVEDTAGYPIDPASVQILVRRRDLSGEGKTDTLRGQGRVLPPGRFDFSLAPSTAYYAATVAGSRPGAGGWTPIELAGPDPVDVKFTLSAHPATLRGVVRNAAHEPVAGAPVYLAGRGSILTDVRGQFEFYGLAPGAHRVLATFDTPDDAAWRVVTLEEGQDQSLDLDLYASR
jgi:protocatechuate 3,4-dioxygenase beta subunit